MRSPFIRLHAVTAALLLSPLGASAATITVNSTADTVANDGLCTLREAIIAANGNSASGAAAGECAAGEAAPTRDLIQFAIAGGGVQRIQPASALPALTETVQIDGYTQTGASRNTVANDYATDAQLAIEIDGSLINAAADGIRVSSSARGVSGTETIIEGLVIDNFAAGGSHGVYVDNANYTVVRGNFIGVNPAGTALARNDNGVTLAGSLSSTGMRVGGFSAGDRNLIAGSGGASVAVVSLSGADRAQIQGNLIGSDRSGQVTLGNAGNAIHVLSTNSPNISKNLVVGSGGAAGIRFTMSDQGMIWANYIGRDLAPTPLANAGHGLLLEIGSDRNAVSQNIITHAGGAGIALTESTANTTVLNDIYGNTIYSVGGIPIDLGADGPTANDTDDADGGPNGRQNYPVLSAARTDGTNIYLTWSLDTRPSVPYEIEVFYAPDGCYPGSSVTAWTGSDSGTGDLSATEQLIAFPVSGGYVSMTAYTGTSGTSELSPCVQLSGTNSAPLAVANSYATPANTQLTVAAPGVLGNDTDPDSDPLTAVIASSTTHGALTLVPNGAIVYTPNAGFAGTDSFTYTATDGTHSSAPATVTITVSNQLPVAAADTYTTGNGQTLTVSAPGVLGNDTDGDGHTLSAEQVTAPGHGSLTLSASGGLVYTPDSGFAGTDTFTYRASDGIAASAPAAVTITVGSGNRAPVAVADGFTVAADGELAVAAPGLLGNDSDADGNTLSAALLSGPAHGTLKLNADGSFSYRPAAGFVGGDSFSYRVTDSVGAHADAVVSITVTSAVPTLSPLALILTSLMTAGAAFRRRPK